MKLNAMVSRRRPDPGYWVLWVLLAGILPLGLGAREQVEIDQVRVRQMEAKVFHRISEYLTGREDTGRRVIVRSDPSKRGGLYFVVRFNHRLDELPESAEVHIAYLWPGSAHILRETFVLPPERKRTRTVFLGLTGKQARDSSLPIAWRIELKDGEGAVLGERKSYLWELPQENAH